MNVEVKMLDDADLALIEKYSPEIWKATYSEILSEDQIEFMLNLSYSLDSLIDQKSSGCVFFGFFSGQKFIGFTSLFPKTEDILRIEKIYLMPENQGKGVGRYSINFIKDFAGKKGFKILELNVNRNNKALNFYQKQGFKIIQEIDIPLNKYILNDYVMQLSI